MTETTDAGGAALGQRIPGREVAAFSAALWGQNVLYGLQMSFFMFAFTEFLGLLPAAVGTLFLVARSWDAVNDPLMGLIADRTRTRWGKFRPWLLGVPIPIAVFTALNFLNPGFGPTGNLVYAYVVYIVWGMLYTVSDIPLWALTSAMSRDSGERTRLISVSRVVSMVGIMLPTLALPFLASILAPGNMYRGYLWGAVLLCALGGPLMTLAFFGTTERVAASPEKLSFRKMLGVLKANGPMRLLVAAMVLNSLVMVAQAGQLYFATYNLGSDRYASVIAGVSLFGLMGGMAVTPSLAKKFGKKGTIIGTAVLQAAAGILFFLVGYGSVPVALAFAFAIGLLMGPYTALQNAMMADSIDYAEYATGERAEGITFSFQTFSNKIVGALSGLVAGLVLAATGYVAGAEQSALALRGMFSMMSLIPAAGALLTILPFLFYPLTEERHAFINAELARGRHAEVTRPGARAPSDPWRAIDEAMKGGRA